MNSDALRDAAISDTPGVSLLPKVSVASTRPPDPIIPATTRHDEFVSRKTPITDPPTSSKFAMDPKTGLRRRSSTELVQGMAKKKQCISADPRRVSSATYPVQSGSKKSGSPNIFRKRRESRRSSSIAPTDSGASQRLVSSQEKVKAGIESLRKEAKTLNGRYQTKSTTINQQKYVVPPPELSLPDYLGRKSEKPRFRFRKNKSRVDDQLQMTASDTGAAIDSVDIPSLDPVVFPYRASDTTPDALVVVAHPPIEVVPNATVIYDNGQSTPSTRSVYCSCGPSESEVRLPNDDRVSPGVKGNANLREKRRDLVDEKVLSKLSSLTSIEDIDPYETLPEEPLSIHSEGDTSSSTVASASTPLQLVYTDTYGEGGEKSPETFALSLDEVIKLLNCLAPELLELEESPQSKSDEDNGPEHLPHLILQDDSVKTLTPLPIEDSGVLTHTSIEAHDGASSIRPCESDEEANSENRFDEVHAPDNFYVPRLGEHETTNLDISSKSSDPLSTDALIFGLKTLHLNETSDINMDSPDERVVVLPDPKPARAIKLRDISVSEIPIWASVSHNTASSSESRAKQQI